MQPLQIADRFTDLLAALMLDVNDEGVYELACDYFNIGSWIDYGTYYLCAGNTLGNTLYLGAPCMEFATYRIAGLITTKNEGEIAVQSLLDLIFLPEAALFDAEGNQLYQPQTIMEGVPPVVYVVVGVVVLLVIFVLTRKSKSPANSAAPVESGSFGHTVSLDRGAGIQPVAPISPIQPIATAHYQIRAIGGQLDGTVKLLNASLRFGRSSRCDVAFPQNAPGISGEHCEVSLEGGRVVLRDLGSSYGTYLNKFTKLEARVPYTLQMGDTFTLADGGQTFRLEKAGVSFSGTGPSVRRVDTGETFDGSMNGQVTFGREMRNTVTFAADSGVSNNHCVLYKEDGQLYLKDVGSTNGTFFAEDKRLKPNHPYKVKKGVSFFLVSRKFSFTITEE
jgi:pSer/pThr/pTyr-binding forkhead associated (FHA) protein